MSHPARQLAFRDEDAVLAEVDRLRGGFHAHGNWSLAQTCWHLNTAVEHCLRPPADPTPRPEHEKYRHMLDGLLAAGVMPDGLPAPEGTEPPDRVDDAAIDAFVAGLIRLKAYGHSHVDFAHFGPTPVEKFRQFVLIHSARHLGMLAPTA